MSQLTQNLLSTFKKINILRDVLFCVRLSRMKVVNLKQAILQAWKERWSDYQWAINIKRNFPKGATWDYLNLAGKRQDEGQTFVRTVECGLKSCYCCGYDVCRGPDGASNDWSLSKPTYFVLPQVRHKLPGEKERCRNFAMNMFKLFAKLCKCPFINFYLYFPRWCLTRASWQPLAR